MYFIVKFKEEIDSEKGPKWISGQHLINAESVTDAEAKLTEHLMGYNTTFDIISVSQSKISNVIE